MEVDQRGDEERSFIRTYLIRFKRYVRGRKLLKYSMFVLGIVLSIVIALYCYINYMSTTADDDSASESKPIAYTEKEKVDSVKIAEEMEGVEIVKDELGKMAEEAEDRREAAFIQEIDNSVEPAERTAESNKASISELLKIADAAQSQKRFHKYVGNESDLIITEVDQNTMEESLCGIYREKIFKNNENNEKCNDNLCGRCKGCSFYDDLEMYGKLAKLSQDYKKRVVIYDTKEKLTEFIEGIEGLYSNLNEKWVQMLTEELMNDRIIRVTIKFTSLEGPIEKKTPLLCSILTEGVENCMLHRFRLQNVLRVDAISFMELFESSFKYQGYSLRASLIAVCRAIAGLSPGESTEVSISVEVPVNESRKGVAVEKNGLNNLKIEKDTKKEIGIQYLIEYFDEENEPNTETVDKYKLCHLVSLFGNKKKAVKKDGIIIAFSPTPNRTVETVFDNALYYFRNLVRLPDREKKNKDEKKYYGSEEVYGVSVLSSLCGWSYGKDPLNIKVVAKRGIVESITACGTTVYYPCTVEEALNLVKLFDQAVTLVNSSSSEFIRTARDFLDVLSYREENSRVEICIAQVGTSVVGEVKMYTPLNVVDFQRSYHFKMIKDMSKALCADTKETWLCTFMQSFAFMFCESLPENSTAIREIVTEKEFLGNDKNTSYDALDQLYAHISKKDASPLNYVIILIGETLFLKFSTEEKGERGSVIHTSLFSHKNKNIVDALREALKSNITYGIFNKRDLVAWSGVKVAYNEYKETISNVSLKVIDFVYYRLYFALRPILNSIKRQNVMEVKANSDSADLEENFFEWLCSLGRFSTLQISHPLIPMLLEGSTGHILDLTIEMLEKKMKSTPGETSCKVSIRSGTFKETVELNYVECDKEPKIISKNEKAFRWMFARILNLPTMKEDSKAYLNIHLETFPHYSQMHMKIVEYSSEGEIDSKPHKVMKIDLNSLKDNAKNFIKQTGDMFLTNIPTMTNGNITIFLVLSR